MLVCRDLDMSWEPDLIQRVKGASLSPCQVSRFFKKHLTTTLVVVGKNYKELKVTTPGAFNIELALIVVYSTYRDITSTLEKLFSCESRLFCLALNHHYV